MLAKYKTLVGASLAQIASDIALLCSGADINALSASCDKAGSSFIANTQAPGWSVLDAAGPTSSVVLTAPDFEGLRPKIAGIGINGTTGIYLTGYDTYNTSTHSGTGGQLITKNITGGGSYLGNVMALATNVVNTLYIFASPRYILISDSSTNNLIFLMEYSRDALYLTNANYPNFCIGDDYLFAGAYATGAPMGVGAPRVKNLAAAGDKASATNTSQLMLRGNSNALVISNANATMRDANDNIYYQLLPINVTQYNNAANYYSSIGVIRDILLPPQGLGVYGDQITVGTDSYFILLANAGRLAIPLV